MDKIERIGYIATNETQRLDSFTRFLYKTHADYNQDKDEILYSAFFNPFSWIIRTNKNEYAGVNMQKCKGNFSPIGYLPFDNEHIDMIYLSPFVSLEDYEFIKSKNPEIEYFVYPIALDGIVTADDYYKGLNRRNADARKFIE